MTRPQLQCSSNQGSVPLLLLPLPPLVSTGQDLWWVRQLLLAVLQ
jgi:hypothetical protein